MGDSNDSDIYADLPKFRYDDDLEKLQASNKNLNEEIAQLNEALAKVTTEKEEYQTKCATLTTNISSLLKTAQAEIRRKDSLISELRSQLAVAGLKNQNNWKRRSESITEASSAKRPNNSFIEKSHEFTLNSPSSKETLDKKSNETKSITRDNKEVSSHCNNSEITSNSKNKPDNINKNKERDVYSPNTNVLPLASKCKTLYSQRMFKKLYGCSATNGPEESIRIETNEKQNLIERNDRNRNGFYEQANTSNVATKTATESLGQTIDCSSKNIEVAYPLNIPLLTNGTNKPSSCIDNSLNQVKDKHKQYNRSESRNLIPGEQQSHSATKNGPSSSTLFQKFEPNKDLDRMKNPLKTLTPLDLPSFESHISENNGEGKNSGKDLKINEKDVVLRELQSSQKNYQITAQERRLSSANDSTNFLRPISSLVIRKPNNNNNNNKKILPISKCWNGLVKTVDSMNCTKECDGVITATAAKEATYLESKINNTNSFKENESVQKEYPTQSEISDNNAAHQSNLVERLFGSPVKWAENSNESVPVLELTPAVYEDSCSAHIENTKFNLTSIKPSSQEANTAQTNLPDKNSINNQSKQIASPQKVQIKAEKKTVSDADKCVRAFEEVGENKQKMKSVFSPLKSGSCSSASNFNLNRESSIDLSLNFPFKSRYEDSVLGQFDDTTQFVSALTKVESKISPLNTPIKSVAAKSDNVSVPLNSVSLEQKVFPQAQNKIESTEITNLSNLSNCRNSNEKPINILYPRKTPRIVTYNKNKEVKSDSKSSPSATTDTPSKCNRFAINDAFISQQEEKVLRICQNNFDDPIAITISAKNKIKGNHTPQGKGIHSPRKTKTLSPLKKNKISVSPKSPRSQAKVLNYASDSNKQDKNVNITSNRHLPNDVDINKSCDKAPQSTRNEVPVEKPTCGSKPWGAADSSNKIRSQNLSEANDLVGNVEIQSTNYNVNNIHSPHKKRNSQEKIGGKEGMPIKDSVKKDLCPLNSKCVSKSVSFADKMTSRDYRKKADEINVDIKSKENLERNVVKEKPASQENGPLEDGGTSSNTMVKLNLNLKKNAERLRFHNFKPSSQLKRIKGHSMQHEKLECERINHSASPKKDVSFPNKSREHIQVLNVKDRSPINNKLNEERIVSKDDNEKWCSRDPRLSPNVIVRSSKKPSFVSTTLLDDDCSSISSEKLPVKNSRNQNVKEVKLKEWVLKPITFDSHDRSFKNRKTIDNHIEVPRHSQVESRNKTMIHSQKDLKNSIRSPDPVSPSPAHIRVAGSGPSPNKIIRARRPLNFGVKITLD